MKISDIAAAKAKILFGLILNSIAKYKDKKEQMLYST